ncbi:hypothetical protein R3P38DRAFT_3220683 [Favolaschia claudopus]|uniref:Uncharacterized protein n=1 Tax=Favolaschia claudopus TaxID=2862362 RepID=A0AAW0A1T4_9AGAR
MPKPDFIPAASTRKADESSEPPAAASSVEGMERSLAVAADPSAALQTLAPNQHLDNQNVDFDTLFNQASSFFTPNTSSADYPMSDLEINALLDSFIPHSDPLKEFMESFAVPPANPLDAWPGMTGDLSGFEGLDQIIPEPSPTPSFHGDPSWPLLHSGSHGLSSSSTVAPNIVDQMPSTTSRKPRSRRHPEVDENNILPESSVRSRGFSTRKRLAEQIEDPVEESRLRNLERYDFKLSLTELLCLFG